MNTGEDEDILFVENLLIGSGFSSFVVGKKLELNNTLLILQDSPPNKQTRYFNHPFYYKKIIKKLNAYRFPFSVDKIPGVVANETGGHSNYWGGYSYSTRNTINMVTNSIVNSVENLGLNYSASSLGFQTITGSLVNIDSNRKIAYVEDGKKKVSVRYRRLYLCSGVWDSLELLISSNLIKSTILKDSDSYIGLYYGSNLSDKAISYFGSNDEFAQSSIQFYSLHTAFKKFLKIDLKLLAIFKKIYIGQIYLHSKYSSCFDLINNCEETNPLSLIAERTLLSHLRIKYRIFNIMSFKLRFGSSIHLGSMCSTQLSNLKQDHIFVCGALALGFIPAGPISYEIREHIHNEIFSNRQ